jgi:hypothetical protein
VAHRPFPVGRCFSLSIPCSAPAAKYCRRNTVIRLECRGHGQNKTARSFRQLRRFHYVINSKKVRYRPKADLIHVKSDVIFSRIQYCEARYRAYSD